MKLQEALDLLQDPEKLRIRAAELDGWKEHYIEADTSESEWVNKKRSYPIFLYQRQLPPYPTDANALHEAEKRLGLHDRSNNALRVKWVNCLHDLMGKQPGCPVNKVGSPTVSDIDVLLAPTPVRCTAYVMAAEWKKVNQLEKKP